MIWADRIAKDLIGKTQHVDDMFTPSGYAHIGSLRGPLLHDMMYKVLIKLENKAIFTYIFNDFDPIDGLSDDLKKEFTKYMGYPLKLAPSPYGKEKNFADYFANDLKKILNELGCKVEYLSSWDLYHQGKFNEVIKEALDNAEKIQNIYQKVSGSNKKETGWYPFQVICPKCSKLGTTKVTDWDGKEVTFTCEENLVTWAKGCGHEGKMSPYDGNGKLPWKVDWPALWKVLGVTFEGAGKDHASKGGSYDIAFALCEEVFKYPKPYYFPYEHFLLGGKKMSSSKGIGLKARDLTTILPPELARFLMIRTIPNRAIELNLDGNTIPQLFDEFDRCAEAYWNKSDKDLGRIFELAKVNTLYDQKIYLPRFISMSQFDHLSQDDAIKKQETLLGRSFTNNEKEVFKERLTYFKIWNKDYSGEKGSIQNKTKELNDKQKEYLKKLAEAIENVPTLQSGSRPKGVGKTDPSALQQIVFNLAQKEDLHIKQAFGAIYITLLGKPHGPKAGELLASFNRDELVNKLTQI